MQSSFEHRHAERASRKLPTVLARVQENVFVFICTMVQAVPLVKHVSQVELQALQHVPSNMCSASTIAAMLTASVPAGVATTRYGIVFDAGSSGSRDKKLG